MLQRELKEHAQVSTLTFLGRVITQDGGSASSSLFFGSRGIVERTMTVVILDQYKSKNSFELLVLKM